MWSIVFSKKRMLRHNLLLWSPWCPCYRRCRSISISRPHPENAPIDSATGCSRGRSLCQLVPWFAGLERCRQCFFSSVPGWPFQPRSFAVSETFKASDVHLWQLWRLPRWSQPCPRKNSKPLPEKATTESTSRTPALVAFARLRWGNSFFLTLRCLPQPSS